MMKISKVNCFFLDIKRDFLIKFVSFTEQLMKEFQLMKESGMDPDAMKFKEGQDEKNTTSLRNFMKMWFEELKTHPTYVDMLEKCTHSTFLVKYSNVRPLSAMSITILCLLMFRCLPTSPRCSPGPRRRGPP